jgi:regulator of protease activity HflC (stomatin/prohibitin superfamily)
VTSPIARIDRFTTKTQLLEQSNFVPTREGLTVELDTALLYRIDPAQASTIFQTVGTNYAPTLVEPEASSTVRGLTSEVDAKALYTSGRSTIQTKLRTELTEKLTPRGILVEDVLLKAIKLPEDLTRSIEQKAKAEQESERMEFVLTKERQEAERKAIEAKGISDFQTIVSKGISGELLQWKGIEATEKLAKSPNSKIVIIGNPKGGGLPVILGGSGQ